MKKLWIPSAIAAAVLSACTPGPGPQSAAAQAPAAAVPAQGNAVDIPPEVQRALGLGFAEVELRQVASNLRLPGAFEYAPTARRQYATPLAGQVEFAVSELDSVEPGQLLAKVHSDEWLSVRGQVEAARQEQDVSLAEGRLVEAEGAELSSRIQALRARIEQLAEAGSRRAELDGELLALEAGVPRIAAAGELWSARAEAAAARAELALERARSLASSGAHGTARDAGPESFPPWIELRAQTAGRVERLFVPQGAHVVGATALLDVVDPTALRLRVSVLSGDVARARGAKVARIVPPGPVNTTGKAAEAALSWDLAADPNTRTLALFATTLQHESWAVPGALAYLELELESSAGPVLAVPRAAIVQDGLQHVFFRRDPRNQSRALRVEADMGLDDGRWVEIKSGVLRGDRVVLQGVYELKLATQSSGVVQKGGHMHADGTFHADH